ncbi:MAG TPA: acyl carrier protein [Candidatus Choladousia intestinavium]|uniref:Acyl carrier protein n=1 Tax=Candidatus Choladousia intestinavium TaxID=2840727 RepID=A0A9D1ADT7_9FIRM|nr:acyl carrier protein [Candidatus Choladousia intestinavium]
MLEEIKDVICEYADVDKNSITEDTRFVEDLGFTSYDFMSMIGELEEKYDVEVDEREVAEIRTVGEAVRYVESVKE